jgi:hypothetical protein
MGQIVPQVTIFPYVAKNEPQIANTFLHVAQLKMHKKQTVPYLAHIFCHMWYNLFQRDTGCSQ